MGSLKVLEKSLNSMSEEVYEPWLKKNSVFNYFFVINKILIFENIHGSKAGSPRYRLYFTCMDCFFVSHLRGFACLN